MSSNFVKIPPSFEKKNEVVEETREFEDFQKKLESVWDNLPEEPSVSDKEKYEAWLVKEYYPRINLMENIRRGNKFPGTEVSLEFDECNGKKHYVWRWGDEEYYCEITKERSEILSGLRTKEDYRTFFSKMFHIDVSDENPQIDYNEEGPIFNYK